MSLLARSSIESHSPHHLFFLFYRTAGLPANTVAGSSRYSGRITSSVEFGGRRRCRTIMSDQSALRSEEHTSELQSLMRISYAVFCLQKKTTQQTTNNTI